MYNLFLDDERDYKKYYQDDFIVARSYDEAVNIILTKGIPNFISFDHDLGDTGEDEKNGYKFAKFLIEHIIDNNLKCVFEFNVHSANPIGAENIRKYLQNAFYVLGE